ncbi:transposase [Rhodococcus sp. USK13]|uniref:transposase n=1 Tax=Rhodococcus sp. USK13 TaxID=2806442 RepID=UPI001BD10E83|nr:transposase [Rhodococcus sp. USK13]
MEAFDDLDAVDALEMLGKAPDPASAARLKRGQITAALGNARRRDTETETDRIQAAMRDEQLGRASVITTAYTATTRSAVAVLTTLNTEIKALHGQVDAHFGRHPDAEIILSQPGSSTTIGSSMR